MRNRSKKKKNSRAGTGDSLSDRATVATESRSSFDAATKSTADQSLFLSLKWVSRDLVGIVVAMAIMASLLVAVKITDDRTHFLDSLSTKVFGVSGL
jgi:hypothetical protein